MPSLVWGFKETKDGVEQAADGVPYEFTNNVSHDGSWDQIEAIKENGFILGEVGIGIEIVLESIKQNAVFATNQGDNELARLLVNVLIDYEQIQKERDTERRVSAEAKKDRLLSDKVRQAEVEKLQHEREVRHGEQSAQEEQRRLAKRESEVRIANELDKRE